MTCFTVRPTLWDPVVTEPAWTGDISVISARVGLRLDDNVFVVSPGYRVSRCHKILKKNLSLKSLQTFICSYVSEIYCWSWTQFFNSRSEIRKSSPGSTPETPGSPTSRYVLGKLLLVLWYAIYVCKHLYSSFFCSKHSGERDEDFLSRSIDLCCHLTSEMRTISQITNPTAFMPEPGSPWTSGDSQAKDCSWRGLRGRVWVGQEFKARHSTESSRIAQAKLSCFVFLFFFSSCQEGKRAER